MNSLSRYGSAKKMQRVTKKGRRRFTRQSRIMSLFESSMLATKAPSNIGQTCSGDLSVMYMRINSWRASRNRARVISRESIQKQHGEQHIVFCSLLGSIVTQPRGNLLLLCQSRRIVHESIRVTCMIFSRFDMMFLMDSNYCKLITTPKQENRRFSKRFE